MTKKKSKKQKPATTAEMATTRVIDAEIMDDKPIMTFAVNFLTFEIIGALKFDDKGRLRLKVDMSTLQDKDSKDGR